MKGLLFGLGIFLSLRFAAQDKIYLLDGQKLEGKVSEISPETILYQVGSEYREVSSALVLLIEFFNGKTQLFHSPYKDVYMRGRPSAEKKPENYVARWQNEFYINTLSLCNADLSMYYEYRLSPKKIGIGLMGTYNFNPYATAPNVFIAVLNNSKKLYDAGTFVNFYTGDEESKLRFYYGLMLKYTAFTFTAVNEDSIYSNNTVSVHLKYQPSSGSQFSTMFNFGFHSDISETLFMKTSFALGFFILKGVYKEQLNYLLSDPQTGYYPDIGVLPKASLGISVGLKF
jgi:outer membrane protein W